MCLLLDANMNERLIEEMKAAMEEQEATMDTQDNVLQSKEDQIQQLSLGTSSEYYNTLTVDGVKSTISNDSVLIGV